MRESMLLSVLIMDASALWITPRLTTHRGKLVSAAPRTIGGFGKCVARSAAGAWLLEHQKRSRATVLAYLWFFFFPRPGVVPLGRKALVAPIHCSD